MLSSEIIEIIEEDIEKCENQKEKNGSYRLYQTLVSKYEDLFPGFKKSLVIGAKMSTGGEFDCRNEINAIKEKLKFRISIERESDPYFNFKKTIDSDIERISKLLKVDNIKSQDNDNYYFDVVYRYHSIIPNFSDGFYNYYMEQGLYDECDNESLKYNFRNIKSKLESFKNMGYPFKQLENKGIQIINNNTNNNKVMVNLDVMINQAKENIENMTALSNIEVKEILTKIDELEEIIKSKDKKRDKWDKAKEIGKWLLDKGIDVCIAVLPILLQI